MAILLCLETATTNCSVALSIHGEKVILKEDNAKKFSHAERLHLYIAEVLAEAAISKDKLDGIAISKGPGSYTGLRIGVSSAKGLCYALDLPLISIDTLGSLSRKVAPVGNYSAQENDLIIPMLDARRMEVYSAVFDISGVQKRETRAEVLDHTSFAEYLEQETVHFIGSGVEKFQEICQHPNAQFILDEHPSAQQMCELAELKFRESNFEDVAYFEPYYLKDFIAGKPKKMV